MSFEVRKRAKIRNRIRHHKREPRGQPFPSMCPQSKKEGKDQESIQSSTTPDPGYQGINKQTCSEHTKTR